MISAVVTDWKPTWQPFGQNNAFKMDYQEDIFSGEI